MNILVFHLTLGGQVWTLYQGLRPMALLKPQKLLMVNILYLNVRGIGNTPTRSRLETLVHSHHADIVIIAEQMVDASNMCNLSHYLDLQGYTSNCSSKGKV